MTDDQFAQWLTLQTRQTAALERIANSLLVISGVAKDGKALSNPPPNPAIQARGPLVRK